MQNYRPFRALAVLTSPIVEPSRPILLDSLVAWAAVDRAKAGGWIPSQNEIRGLLLDLPLAKHSYEDEWVWMASCMMWRGTISQPFQHQFTLKVDKNDYARDRNSIYKKGPSVLTEGTGQFKLYDLRQTLRQAEMAECYGVGDIDAVTELLHRVPAIGKRTRCGWGTVKSWTIKEMSENECEWWLRPIPFGMKNSLPPMCDMNAFSLGRAVTTPPYWDRVREQKVIIPIQSW